MKHDPVNAALHTRDKIIELGRSYIQEIGYPSFNYKQVATVLQIKNAAIHHYYPSKEDLGLAIIEKDKQDFLQMTKRLQHAKPGEKLETFLKIYERYFTEGKKMCLVGAFSSAYHAIPEKIQVAAADYLQVITSWIKACMQEGLESGEFRFKNSAEEMTDLWIAALPGSLQVGRIRGKIHFRKILDGLRKSLGN